jgi:ketopantoate hydroxymethyltransferase
MEELQDLFKYLMQKINYKKLLLKKNKEPISCLTAYSKPLANILDGNVDLILVGDFIRHNAVWYEKYQICKS